MSSTVFTYRLRWAPFNSSAYGDRMNESILKYTHIAFPVHHRIHYVINDHMLQLLLKRRLGKSRFVVFNLATRATRNLGIMLSSSCHESISLEIKILIIPRKLNTRGTGGRARKIGARARSFPGIWISNPPVKLKMDLGHLFHACMLNFNSYAVYVYEFCIYVLSRSKTLTTSLVKKSYSYAWDVWLMSSLLRNL